MPAQEPEVYVEDDSKMQASPTMAQLHTKDKKQEAASPERITQDLSGVSDNESYMANGTRSPGAFSAVAAGQSVDFVTVKRMMEQEKKRRDQVEMAITTDTDRKWGEEMKYRKERDTNMYDKRDRKDREKANLRQMQDEATARRRAKEDEELNRFREQEDSDERQHRYDKDLQEK